MFDDYLVREDVKKFIKEIKTNDCYFDKNKRQFSSHSLYLSNELALYIFYDALLKFKLIIQDIEYLSDYLVHLERLYKKIDSFDGLEVGISKLICKMVSIKLHLENSESKEAKINIIRYIYHNYIEEGYYIHGFNTSYSMSIISEGFVPEIYQNYYIRFVELNKILKKYGLSEISKDFSSNNVSFTDDFVLGCYYSNYAPMFFYKFLNQTILFKRRNQQDAYLIDNYSIVMRRLKRFMNFHMFSKKDKEFVYNLVKDEWDLLHRCSKKVSLLLVKRRIIQRREVITLDDYLFDDKNINEVVDRILCSKQKNIFYKEVLEPGSFELLNLDYYYEYNYEKVKEENVNLNYLNAYGKVSILLLLGSMFITLGVLISIFMMLGE